MGAMRELLPTGRPALVLAPMQDVTDLAFMRVIARRGAPDWFVTEYFRVHADSRLERHILRAVTENPTGRPVFAQMIGGHLPSLARAAGELERHAVAGIDLNLGCPAPIVCRKNAGGGLLRDREALRRLLGGLREAVTGVFTVKTRLGFREPEEFAELLEVFAAAGVDGVSVHARTVAQGYRGAVQDAWVRQAVASLPCPVVANGNIVDAATGVAYHRRTGAHGLMVGRGAIRNPWIFRQLRGAFGGEAEPCVPTRRELLEYIGELSDAIAAETRRLDPLAHVQRMKRFLVYISHGLDAEFEYRIRRCATPEEFQRICCEHLDSATPLPATPPAESTLFSGFSALLA